MYTKVIIRAYQTLESFSFEWIHFATITDYVMDFRALKIKVSVVEVVITWNVEVHLKKMP